MKMSVIEAASSSYMIMTVLKVSRELTKISEMIRVITQPKQISMKTKMTEMTARMKEMQIMKREIKKPMAVMMTTKIMLKTWTRAISMTAKMTETMIMIAWTKNIPMTAKMTKILIKTNINIKTDQIRTKKMLPRIIMMKGAQEKTMSTTLHHIKPERMTEETMMMMIAAKMRRLLYR